MKDKSQTLRVLRTIITSLEYSKDKIRNYPYQRESDRALSMQPIEDALQWARDLRDSQFKMLPPVSKPVRNKPAARAEKRRAA